MKSMTRHNLVSELFVAFTAATLLVAGCTSANNGSNPSTPPAQTGSSFVTGTDAPMASVVSFSVQIQSVNATDADGNTVSLISGTPTVDFARYNGLQTLLDMNDVAVGTYSNVSITLGAATIGYLQTPQGGGPPQVATMPATYANSASTFTYTGTLANPIVVTESGAPAGLHLDFDLRKSITVDGTGQITGAVTPTFNLNGVANSDPGAYIDCFDAAVVSVGSQSFVVQGPHGRKFTVNVSGQTEWENNEGLSDLSSSSIVTLSGSLDRADATIDADDVAILSQNGFWAGGLVTSVAQPAAGDPATSFDLYVRGLLPTTTGLTLGQVATVDLSGNEKFFIYWFHNPLTEFLFNSSQLLPGQHVSVGGSASGAASSSAVTVKRVVLRDWGYNGTLVANSVNSSNTTNGASGSFQMQVDGFAGTLIPQTVTVYTGAKTEFRGGLTDLNGLNGSQNVRVVGLLLVTQNGNPVLLAHYVDELN
jgi:Domain of unknown function (DUF4382)/Domain of unknown function (DUF5666)